jgi:hypothetical protein
MTGALGEGGRLANHSLWSFPGCHHDVPLSWVAHGAIDLRPRSLQSHDQLTQNEDAVGWGITYWRRVLEPHAPEPALRNY